MSPSASSRRGVEGHSAPPQGHLPSEAAAYQAEKRRQEEEERAAVAQQVPRLGQAASILVIALRAKERLSLADALLPGWPAAPEADDAGPQEGQLLAQSLRVFGMDPAPFLGVAVRRWKDEHKEAKEEQQKQQELQEQQKRFAEEDQAALRGVPLLDQEATPEAEEAALRGALLPDREGRGTPL